MAGLDFASWTFVALGSNQGDSPALIRRAFERLSSLSSGSVIRSSLWKTEPVDCPPGSPDFLNAVAALTPRETDPESFLRQLQSLEKEFGRRTKREVNEARPMDLDIILWKDAVCVLSTLVIPHPRALERRFVLEPLAEIAPGLEWPGTRRTVTQLCEAIRLNGQLIEKQSG